MYCNEDAKHHIAMHVYLGALLVSCEVVRLYLRFWVSMVVIMSIVGGPEVALSSEV